MAVLSHDEFMARVRARIGEASDDDSISFIEDMSDTFSALEERASTNWEEEYRRNDEMWRRRYIDRFESGSPAVDEGRVQVDTVEENDEGDRSENITVEDILYREG